MVCFELKRGNSDIACKATPDFALVWCSKNFIEMDSINPRQTKAWKTLEKLAERAAAMDLSSLQDDSERAKHFQIKSPELLFQYSRNLIDKEILAALFQLADETRLKRGIEAMFNGEKINRTENRAVLHTALRSSIKSGFVLDGQDIYGDIHSVLDQMRSFSDKLRNGIHGGYTGKQITDVVNIGIGGSDLGPNMAYEALKGFSDGRIKAHFVSNVDGAHLHLCLKDLDPETSLFIVASKSFTTQETMANAKSARDWFLESAKDPRAIAQHFVALSTNIIAVKEFGIAEENIFGFWDWVGGRYSMWSAIGLSLCCSLGFDNFEQMLRGAEEIDTHFKESPLEQNIPVIMALVGIWYNNFLKWESHAILPYDQRLHRLAAYLQQADMESNGKTASRSNEKVDYQTGPIIWGEPGTNGQHAFYQLLHQGTKKVSSDFIASVKADNPYQNQHELLLANFMAQPQALMNGLSKEHVKAQMIQEGKSKEQIDKLLAHRIFEGNRPSNLLLFKQMNPFSFGKLIALYEHKIFVQGWIWNIFSFDQWGVQLGKKLADGILDDMGKKDQNKHSTIDCINQEVLKTIQNWSN